MDLHIDFQTVITAGAFITALGIILSKIFKGHEWFLEQNGQSKKIEKLEAKHDADMKESNEERQLICFALAACLDGLEQLGCNHTVPEAKNKLQKHLNKKAHIYHGGKENEN